MIDPKDLGAVKDEIAYLLANVPEKFAIHCAAGAVRQLSVEGQRALALLVIKGVLRTMHYMPAEIGAMAEYFVDSIRSLAAQEAGEEDGHAE